MPDLVVWLPIVIAAVAAAIAALTYQHEWEKKRQKKLLTTFYEARRIFKERTKELVDAGLERYADQRLPGFRMLGRPAWVFDQPRPLEALNLVRAGEDWVERREELDVATARLQDLWPRAEDGSKILRYSDAVRQYDRPALWSTDTPTFRLVELRERSDGLDLHFEICDYHDATDTQEAFAFVVAAGLSPKKYLPSDPFNLRGRGASTGVLTLTLIDGAEQEFLFHRRGTAGVGQGPGQFHVVPAGEFQPAVVGPEIDLDFDLWTNIQREFAEEFLGLPDGLAEVLDDRPTVDDPRLQLLQNLYESGDLRLYSYGIAMNPSTLKIEILTVAVLSEEAKGAIVPKDAQDHEGTKLLRPFTTKEVKRLMAYERTNPATHALLTLALRDRDILFRGGPQA